MPTYNEAELAAIKRKEEVADATRLDDDEEAALEDATTEDLMTLAEILGSNPQEFIMEAYADPLKVGFLVWKRGENFIRFFLTKRTKFVIYFCNRKGKFPYFIIFANFPKEVVRNSHRHPEAVDRRNAHNLLETNTY